jgi:hypothetical protein
MTSKRTLALSALALIALAGSAAAAEEGGLQACRAIGDAARRLACYDALPLPAADAAAPNAAPKPGAAATPAAAPHDPANFGFEAKAAQATQAALPSIGSYIPGRFEGWGPRQRIKLANGQVWQVTDDSNAAMSVMDPKVTIRRGALGAFYLEFEQSNRTARVKRIE